MVERNKTHLIVQFLINQKQQYNQVAEDFQLR